MASYADTTSPLDTKSEEIEESEENEDGEDSKNGEDVEKDECTDTTNDDVNWFYEYVESLDLVDELLKVMTSEEALHFKYLCHATMDAVKGIEEAMHQLLPQQISHYYHLLDIYREKQVALDNSPMGSGKNKVALQLARRMNLRPIIVCPTIATDIWKKDLCENYMTCEGFISPSDLSCVKGELLTQMCTIESKSDASYYTSTNWYASMIVRGVMLIVDEAHIFVDGPSIEPGTAVKTRTLHGIIRHILCTPGSTSKVLFLCGSKYKTYDLIQWLLRCHDDTAAFVQYQDHPTLFEHEYSSSMIAPVGKDYVDSKNLLCVQTNADMDKHVAALRELYIKATIAVDMYGTKRTKALSSTTRWGLVRSIECSIAQSIAQIVVRRLDADSTCKAIIAVASLDAVAEINNYVTKHARLSITTRVPIKTRLRYIDLFQREPSYRLLIVMGSTIATSLNLHDVDGAAARWLYLSPFIKMKDKYQLVGRIARTGLKSVAHIRYFHTTHFDRSIDTVTLLDRLDRSTETTEMMKAIDTIHLPVVDDCDDC